MLGVLTQEQLAHSLFPLGDTPKSQVRDEAERRGLSVAQKPDSHDICFISDGDTGGWLREKLGAGSGEIVDHASGEVLGHHEGAFGFTVGQRKGLRIGQPGRRRPAPLRPRHRAGLRHRHRRAARGAHRRRAQRHPAALVRTTPVGLPLAGHRAAARPRRRAPCRGRRWTATHVSVELLDPAQGIAPGQAAVVYDGSRVVGSCTIAATVAQRERPRVIVATGVGSMPGADAAAYDHAVRVGARASCPTCPHLPELPGRGAHADDDRPRAGRRRRARRRPAAGRAGGSPGARPAASTTAGPGRCSRRTSTCVEEHTQGYTGRLQDPGHRPVDAGRDRRAAARRPGARRPRCPPRAGPGAGRGAARPRRRRAASGARAPSWWCRSTSRRCRPCWPAGCRPPPASTGTARSTPRRQRRAGVGVRRDHRAGCHPGGALLRGRRADRPAGRGRCRRASRSTSTCSPAAAYDDVADAARAGRAGAPGGGAVDRDPAHRARRTAVDRAGAALLDMLGLDPESAPALVVTPSCGLAGADPDWARRACALCRTVAADLRP